MIRLRDLISEQGALLGNAGNTIDLVKNVTRSSGAKRMPGTEFDGPADFDNTYTDAERVQHFLDNAKTLWNYPVDKTYMNNIISKLYDNLGKFTKYNTDEVLRLLSQVKTEAGIGYLARNFRMNGKDLYSTLEKYHMPWPMFINILQTNKFHVPTKPSDA